MDKKENYKEKGNKKMTYTQLSKNLQKKVLPLLIDDFNSPLMKYYFLQKAQEFDYDCAEIKEYVRQQNLLYKVPFFEKKNDDWEFYDKTVCPFIWTGFLFSTHESLVISTTELRCSDSLDYNTYNFIINEKELPLFPSYNSLKSFDILDRSIIQDDLNRQSTIIEEGIKKMKKSIDDYLLDCYTFEQFHSMMLHSKDDISHYLSLI